MKFITLALVCLATHALPGAFKPSYIQFILFSSRMSDNSIVLSSTISLLTLLSPKLKSDKHLNSPYNITSWPNIQVMRIKKMITRHEMC